VRKKVFHVYILSSRSRNLYIGSSGDIVTRVWEHKAKARDGYTARYNIYRLVHLEEYLNPRDAYERERELKTWIRARKIELIEENNPPWQDLSAGWYQVDVGSGVQADPYKDGY
jgi:putative endonuclease